MGWDNPPVSWRELQRRMSWGTGRPSRRGPAAPAGPRRPAPRPAGTTPWAELHCHSSFSFLDGAATPGELVAEAARLGLEVLALTDHDGMYGVPQFAQAAARLADRGGPSWARCSAPSSAFRGAWGAAAPQERGIRRSPDPDQAATCWSWPGTPKATGGCAP